MDFMLSKALLSRINMWEQLYNEKKVDLVLCSLPLLTALKKMLDISNELNIGELSMGMSSDYMQAINHKATYLRIGSAIFGERSR